jgi:hypothetical protein
MGGGGSALCLFTSLGPAADSGRSEERSTAERPQIPLAEPPPAAVPAAAAPSPGAVLVSDVPGRFLPVPSQSQPPPDFLSGSGSL